MAGTQVNPTRMELTRLKKKLVTAVRGHKLLKDKRDELMRQFLDKVRENKALREEVETALVSANQNFMLARAGMPDEMLNTALLAPKQELTISAGTQNVMSVEIPDFDFKTRTPDQNDMYSYGFAFTTGDLDDAILSLSEVFPKMLKLAEVEKSCQLMAAEIEKTRRRVNALEHVMIPELQTNIKYITVLATGYNVVDIACARERGIPVCNVPAYGTASVSQYAIALLLEACHHIGHHSDAVHAGRWASCPDWCFWDYPLIELEHKTIGIIGFGRIGQSTGRIAKALGMRVLAYDVFPTDAGRAVGEYVELDTLLAASDVIALHCNLTPENEKIICRENIAKMKDGVILVNNARGQLVAEQDLADALNSGKVAAAALDVVSTEPIRSDNPLLQAKNCILTPHISWAPIESRQRILDCTIRNVRQFLSGTPENNVWG